MIKVSLFGYAKVNQDSVYDGQSDRMWLWVILEDALAGGYAWYCRYECTDFESCPAHIQLTTPEQDIFNLGAAIWRRPEIERSMPYGSMG